MNRSVPPKRKRPGQDPAVLTSDEQHILDIILSKEGSGILMRELKFQSSIRQPNVTKAYKSLMAKALIHEVKGVGTTKVIMGIRFTPSDQVSGGLWYEEGKLNTEFVDALKFVIRKHLRTNKVATLEGLYKYLKETGAARVEIPMPQLRDLLVSMVLDNEIVEVKSNGLGDFFRIKVGETCYRLPSAAAGGAAKTPDTGAFASIPCGMCPVISQCTPDGVISPATCVYYNKWLDVKLKSSEDQKKK